MAFIALRVRRYGMKKAINAKRRFLIQALSGTSRFEWLLEIKRRFYIWLVNRMSEGEVLRRYYELTNKEVVE